MSRKEKTRIEDLDISRIDPKLMEDINKTLSKQIDWENFTKKYAKIGDILKLVGLGVFIAGSIAIPNLPLALKPIIEHKRKQQKELWKRFNIPYLKRTLRRLEQQKLVEISDEDGIQVARITKSGQRKVLKFAIDELAVEKPKLWDGRWTLISYDIPKSNKHQRAVFMEYLRAWGFYPLHESTFLHAYPCEKRVEFLREYLGIGEYVRIFIVTRIENDKPFRDFFGV